MNGMSRPIVVAEMGVFPSLGNPPGKTWEAPAVSCAMQNTLVPPLSYKGLSVKAHGRSVPKDDVGGDLVDLVVDGQEVTAYVADVSGHGLRAGILMGMIKTAMRYGLLLGQPLTKLLGDLNHVLPNVKEPHMFATLAALRFDRGNHVEYVSVGHVPLIHYRQGSREVVRYFTSQFPLGLFAGDEYKSGQIQYEPGDIFALVTDGVLETDENYDQDLGFKRLAQILRDLSGHPLSDILEAIYDGLTRNRRQDDDQTVLLVRAVEDSDANAQRVTSKQDREVANDTQLVEAKWRNLLEDLAEELSRD